MDDISADEIDLLLSQIRWQRKHQERIFQVFDKYATHRKLDFDGFKAAVSQVALIGEHKMYVTDVIEEGMEINKAANPSYYRAFGWNSDSGQLSVVEFLLGLGCINSTTPHAGTWEKLRTQVIFKFYDHRRTSQLGLEELSHVVRDVMVARQDSRGNTAVTRHTANDLLGECTSLSFTQFVTLLETNEILSAVSMLCRETVLVCDFEPRGKREHEATNDSEEIGQERNWPLITKRPTPKSVCLISNSTNSYGRASYRDWTHVTPSHVNCQVVSLKNTPPDSCEEGKSASRIGNCKSESNLRSSSFVDSSESNLTARAIQRGSRQRTKSERDAQNFGDHSEFYSNLGLSQRDPILTTPPTHSPSSCHQQTQETNLNLSRLFPGVSKIQGAMVQQQQPTLNSQLRLTRTLSEPAQARYTKEMNSFKKLPLASPSFSAALINDQHLSCNQELFTRDEAKIKLDFKSRTKHSITPSIRDSSPATFSNQTSVESSRQFDQQFDSAINEYLDLQQQTKDSKEEQQNEHEYCHHCDSELNSFLVDNLGDTIKEQCSKKPANPKFINSTSTLTSQIQFLDNTTDNGPSTFDDDVSKGLNPIQIATEDRMARQSMKPYIRGAQSTVAGPPEPLSKSSSQSPSPTSSSTSSASSTTNQALSLFSRSLPSSSSSSPTRCSINAMATSHAPSSVESDMLSVNKDIKQGQLLMVQHEYSHRSQNPEDASVSSASFPESESHYTKELYVDVGCGKDGNELGDTFSQQNVNRVHVIGSNTRNDNYDNDSDGSESHQAENIGSSQCDHYDNSDIKSEDVANINNGSKNSANISNNLRIVGADELNIASSHRTRIIDRRTVEKTGNDDDDIRLQDSSPEAKSDFPQLLNLNEVFTSYSKGEDNLDEAAFCTMMIEEFGVHEDEAPVFFRALDNRRANCISQRDFYRSFAFMQPDHPNNEDRLDFVYRGYADAKTQRLSLEPFILMIKHIQHYRGIVGTDAEHAETARQVFEASNVDLADGYVAKAQFISACISCDANVGFHGTENLLRLEKRVEIETPLGNEDFALDENRATIPISDQTQPSVKVSSVDASPSVNIRRRVIYPMGAGVHSPISKQKIHRCELEAPSPAAVWDDMAEIIERVLHDMLCDAYVPPFSSDGSVVPFEVLSQQELMKIIPLAQAAVARDAIVTHIQAPVKVFGDLHGQVEDILNFFRIYGAPDAVKGDIHYVSYLFIGDFVDRGSHSLEVMALLLCLKLRYPQRIFLIRGNHEDSSINSYFGFKDECTQRLTDGYIVWQMMNQLFEYLPLAAVIDNSILCIHGGIGQKIIRPFDASAGEDTEELRMVRDVLWSDPTQSDSHLGLRTSSTRGSSVVEFGPDMVRRFLRDNGLQMIVRAHQCVKDGYEFFADQLLVTVFSATNYCGRFGNDGAMLIINRELSVAVHVIKSDSRTSLSWRDRQLTSPVPPQFEYGLSI